MSRKPRGERREDTTPESEPVIALAFGHLKDGRFAVAELQLRDGATTGGQILCTSPNGHYAARAWLQCAYLRLCERREYSEAEAAMNAKDTAGAALEDFAHGEAGLLVPRGKQYTATHMAISDGVVLEPRLLCVSDKLTAWSTLCTWAAQHLLPRRTIR